MTVRFAALRNRHARPYLIGTGLAMMADNIEHVITYLLLWELFHNSYLVGFQVISHWVPFLLLSYWFGSLADRFDCRRVIQIGQFLFMAVSLTWAVLFWTHTLQIWMACVLLVLHGIAGAMWGPAEQMMLHDFVDEAALPSAVRLNATAKSLGILLGPVIGSLLMGLAGPVGGLVINAAIYLPLTIYLFITPFTGHTRAGGPRAVRGGWGELFGTIRSVRANPTLAAMIVLGGLGSFFIGASLQAAMPVFADDLDAHGHLVYGTLLFATGAGGVLGGIALEASGSIPSTVRSAVISTLVYGGSILAFAATHVYPVAIVLLFVAGVANMAAMSIGQTVVQLEARPDERGRVIGLYNVSASGLRFGSGFTVGVLGALLGVRLSLGVSAGALLLGAALAAVVARHRHPVPDALVIGEQRPSTRKDDVPR